MRSTVTRMTRDGSTVQMDTTDSVGVPAEAPVPAPEPAPLPESDLKRTQRLCTETTINAARINFAADYIGMASSAQMGVIPQIIVDYETARTLRKYMPANQQAKLKFDETKDAHGLLSSQGWAGVSKQAFLNNAKEIMSNEHFVNVRYPSILLEFQSLAFRGQPTSIDFMHSDHTRKLEPWHRDFLISKGFTVIEKKSTDYYNNHNIIGYTVRTWSDAASSSSSSSSSKLPSFSPAVLDGLKKLTAM